MPLTQRLQLRGNRGVLLLREIHEAQQHIRDALGRGQHHRQPRLRLPVDDGGDLGEARGVVDTGTAELVDDPGRGKRPGLGNQRVASMWREVFV